MALRALGWLARLGWRWRVELAALLAIQVVWGWLDALGGTPVAVLGGGLLAAGLVAPKRCRAWLWAVERRSWLRRRWAKACRHAGLETCNERIPRMTRLAVVPAGDVLRVRVPAGECVGDLEDRADVLAAGLRVREVQVVQDPDDARYAQVTLVRRDPLAGAVILPWPHLDAERLSLWQAIPVGVDECGQPIDHDQADRR